LLGDGEGMASLVTCQEYGACCWSFLLQRFIL
jgi:hypothetical protein